MAWSAPDSACPGDRPNKWSWDQVLRNTGGSKITLTERVNYQDNVLFSRANDSIGIDPGASFTRPTFVCLASSAQHIFRTDWTGSDAAGNQVSTTGPTVTLQKKP